MFTFLFGYMHLGSCDYFRYNGGEFYVTARMFHVQLCPLGADQAVLRIPGMGDRGMTVSQVPGVLTRCLQWAALRSYPTLAGVILAITSIYLLAISNIAGAAFLFVLAFLLLVVGIWAILKKPKAPEEAIRAYMNLIRPRKQWPPEPSYQVRQGSFREKIQDSVGRVVDMVRSKSFTHAQLASDSADNEKDSNARALLAFNTDLCHG